MPMGGEVNINLKFLGKNTAESKWLCLKNYKLNTLRNLKK